MALWQVALTVEASAPTLPKGVTHGSFCSMVQETLKARRRRERLPHGSPSKSVPSRRRLTRFSARAPQKCVPNLPSDKEMEENDMFESSLLVVTDQEEDVPFNCDEDVRGPLSARRLRSAHVSTARAAGGVRGDDLFRRQLRRDGCAQRHPRLGGQGVAG
jgi:hypothetical protein